MRYILLTLSILLYGITSFAQKELFAEDFKNNKNNWEENLGINQISKIRDGSFFIRNTDRNGNFFILKEIYFEEDSNYHIQARFDFNNYKNDLGKNSFYGIAWGFDNKRNGFVAHINSKGILQVGKWINNKYQLLGSKDIDFLLTLDFVVLSIKKIDDRFYVYVHEIELFDYPAEMLFGNKQGFIFDNKLKLNISNYLIEAIPATRRTKKNQSICKSNTSLNLSLVNTRYFHENSILKGGTTNKITFSVVNSCNKKTSSGFIYLTPLDCSEGIDYEGMIYLRPLEPMQQITVSTELIIRKTAISKNMKFRAEIWVNNFMISEPVFFNFQIVEFETPKFEIENIVIRDKSFYESQMQTNGNNNGIIDTAETIEIDFDVKNIGSYISDITVKPFLKAFSREITLVQEGLEINLEDFNENQSKKLTLGLILTQHYDLSTVEINFKFRQYNLDVNDYLVTIPVGEKWHQKNSPYQSEFELNKYDNPKWIPELKNFSRSENTIAIIIGADERSTAYTNYSAEKDAQIFYHFCKTILNIPENKIYIRLNKNIDLESFMSLFESNGWISDFPKHNVLIYYSGHGSPKNMDAYGILAGINPYYSTKSNRINIYNSVNWLPIIQLTVISDPCFSTNRKMDERKIENFYNLIKISQEEIDISFNTIVIQNTSFAEYGETFDHKDGGVFSYYLFKSLVKNANKQELNYSELFHDCIKKLMPAIKPDYPPQIIGFHKKKQLFGN